MINENILGKCFRGSRSFINPRISPLTIKYRCPQLSLSIITPLPETNGNRSGVLFHYPMLTYSTARKIRARFEHSNFLKVNGPGPRRGRDGVAPTPPPPFRRPHPSQRGGRGAGGRRWAGRYSPSSRRTGLASPRDPTTSFLTATTLIYAIGAGKSEAKRS